MEGARRERDETVCEGIRRVLGGLGGGWQSHGGVVLAHLTQASGVKSKVLAAPSLCDRGRRVMLAAHACLVHLTESSTGPRLVADSQGARRFACQN